MLAASEPPASAPALVTPSSPAVPSYSTRDSPALAGDAFGARIAETLAGARKERGVPALTRDGRLDRVALDVLTATGPCRAPAADLVAFLLWRQGIVEPEPALFLHCGDDGAEPTALSTMRAQLAEGAGQGEWRRVGIGVERVAGRWQAVVVLQGKSLELEPVPRALAPGGQAPIAGRIRAGLRAPEVLITPPRGAVLRPTTTVRHDAFAARLECRHGRGVYQVEVIAQDERGPRVVANFPVYCGVAEPKQHAPAEPAAEVSLDPTVLERQLLDLLARDRARAGLPALIRDTRLGVVARAYSREMAETGDVAHVSARSGNVIDRVRAAGVTPPPVTLAENVASAASAPDAQRAFMGSPGHRDNVLSPEVTHVGVGVAVGRAAGPTVPLYFTQIFAGWRR